MIFSSSSVYFLYFHKVMKTLYFVPDFVPESSGIFLLLFFFSWFLICTETSMKMTFFIWSVQNSTKMTFFTLAQNNFPQKWHIYLNLSSFQITAKKSVKLTAFFAETFSTKMMLFLHIFCQNDAFDFEFSPPSSDKTFRGNDAFLQ